MPTIFSHAIFASAIGRVFNAGDPPARFWMIAAICAMLPDLDVVSFGFGVRYGSMFGHRGITHSILFAALVGFVVSTLFSMQMPRWKTAICFALVTLSHPLLDMLTDGGSGVALFAPFSNARFFFPWQPIEVSPIGLRFFSDRGIDVILSEFLWIWIPSAIIFIVALLARRRS